MLRGIKSHAWTYLTPATPSKPPQAYGYCCFSLSPFIYLLVLNFNKFLWKLRMEKIWGWTDTSVTVRAGLTGITHTSSCPGIRETTSSLCIFYQKSHKFKRTKLVLIVMLGINHTPCCPHIKGTQMTHTPPPVATHTDALWH